MHPPSSWNRYSLCVGKNVNTQYRRVWEKLVFLEYVSYSVRAKCETMQRR
jgi:hypothetical protein